MALQLNKLAKFPGRPGPLLFVVMDGVGVGKPYPGNAWHVGRTPTLDRLMKGPLVTRLKAHGPAVGLPSDDDMGNSEVGHNAIGAGRAFDQGAKLVNKAIASGDLFADEVWQAVEKRGREGATVHFIGLLSDGNVHSHIDHLFALVRRCADAGIRRVRVHVLLDGRDVGERTALSYLEPTEKLLADLSKKKGADYRIASGGGRMVVTMDRYEADWDVVKKGWDAHVLGEGRAFASASEAVRTYYDDDKQMTDQYLDSFVVADERGEPVGRMRDGDAVVFFNFRGDRAIEISRAFEEDDFDEFDRGARPRDLLYAGMLEYDGDLKVPKRYLVPPPRIDRTMGEYLVGSGVPGFAISETQKFGHVTYFWNGNRSGYIDRGLEEYDEIPSDRITFDKAPKMKAWEITDKTIELLRSGRFRWGRINLANGDMVGHTGVLPAAVEAIETVDACVARLVEAIEELRGVAIVTADHGNCEEMYTEKNGVRTPKTSHTLNPVPFVIVDPLYNGEYRMAELKTPSLTNLAATTLNLLGFEAPEGYDPSLIAFP